MKIKPFVKPFEPFSPLRWHFESIKDELCWVLTFHHAEWLKRNLWVSERDLCRVEMLNAIPFDLCVAISLDKFIDALKIVRKHRHTLHEVQIACNVSTTHFEIYYPHRTMFDERVQIERPIGDDDFTSEFCIRFSEHDTKFDYELAISWDMLGLSHCETVEDIYETLRCALYGNAA